MTDKVKKTYRFDQKTVDELARIAEETGKTATQVLTEAVAAYGRKPYESHTADAGELSAIEAQLAEKDRQIAELHTMLADQQAITKAAQAMQAAQVPGLAQGGGDGDGKRRSFWRRWFG